MIQYLLKAIGTRDMRNLTQYKTYTTLEGIEEGIFENRPYVSVIDDDGIKCSCHLSRFEIIEEIVETD